MYNGFARHGAAPMVRAADLSQKITKPLKNFVAVVPCSGSSPNKTSKVVLALCLV